MYLLILATCFNHSQLEKVWFDKFSQFEEENVVLLPFLMLFYNKVVTISSFLNYCK